MNMAVIQMPSRNGQNETGMITKWHKKTGDWIAEGDELFSFDTDDGSYTVKSQRAGRLVAIFVPEGELVHCPADVGMLATPAPDSALRVGQMQFLNPDVPALVPQFDDIVKGEDPDTEDAPAGEESPEAAPEENADADEAEAPEAETAKDTEETKDAPDEEPAPDAAEEEAPAGEISAEEAPEAAPAEEPAEEELSDEPAVDEEDIPAEEESVEEADSAAEEENTDEADKADDSDDELPACEEELLDHLPTEDADALDEFEAMELPAEESDEAPEESAEMEDAAPAANEPAPAEAAAPVEAAAPAVSPRPASLTAEVDLTVCGELLNRTAATLPALVRFAAMHTDDAALLDPVADGSLRALSACAALPNVDDLSALGVIAASRSVRGMRFLVPASHEAFTVQDGALMSYTALNLTLAFDENDIPFDAAARLLRQTAAHLENLFDLLI